MLSRIWGLTLIIVGLYVAYELYHFPDPKPKNRISRNSPQKSQHTTDPKSAPTSGSSPTSPSSSTVSPESISANSSRGHRVKKSDQEIALSVSEICEEMEDEIKAARLPVTFARVKIHFREKRLEAPGISEAIKNCFRQNSSSPNDLEIEAFSSEFGGEAKSQVQLQVSIFNKNFKDKLYEVGRNLDLDRFDDQSQQTPSPATMEESSDSLGGFHPIEN